MSEVMDWHCQHMPKACSSYDHATQEIGKKELVFFGKSVKNSRSILIKHIDGSLPKQIRYTVLCNAIAQVKIDQTLVRDTNLL
jgi:hypothetical protein